jgi:hypothetical protein
LSRLLIALASVAGAPIAELQASAAAMDCCAKTNYDCAGLSAPDDCCQRMGRATHAIAGTVQADRDTLIILSSVAALPRLDAVTRPRDAARSAFVRPHDPPHLHSFSLLI